MHQKSSEPCTLPHLSVLWQLRLAHRTSKRHWQTNQAHSLLGMSVVGTEPEDAVLDNLVFEDAVN